MFNIYIPEAIPSGNKGEEAILRGIHKGLEIEGENADISVFSFSPEQDTKNYGSNFKIIDGISIRPKPGLSPVVKFIQFFKIWCMHLLFYFSWCIIGRSCLLFFRKNNWKAYLDANVILVGHDGALSDINLPFAMFARGLRKRTAIFGCGFNPFRFRLSERIAPYILSNMDLVTLREKRSYDYLRSIGAESKNIYLKPDPAFLMSPARNELVDEFFKKEGLLQRKKPLIGMVAIRGSAHFHEFQQDVKDTQEKYHAHTEFFARMVETVLEVTDGTVVFLPHSIQTSNNRDDRVVARDVVKKLVKNQQNVVLAENEYHASVLKGVIQQLDFIVSQRLHSIIGASSVATPLMMLTVRGDRRAHDILEHTIGRNDLLFDLNRPDIHDFEDKFSTLWEQRVQIHEYLKQQAASIYDECRQGAKLLAALV